MRLPRPSIRLRLTAWYATIFIAMGIVLLAVSYAVVRREFRNEQGKVHVAVEDNGVVVDDRRARERLLAVERDVHCEPVAAQAARERLREPRLVFGDENAHRHRERSVT